MVQINHVAHSSSLHQNLCSCWHASGSRSSAIPKERCFWLSFPNTPRNWTICKQHMFMLGIACIIVVWPLLNLKHTKGKDSPSYPSNKLSIIKRKSKNNDNGLPWLYMSVFPELTFPFSSYIFLFSNFYHHFTLGTSKLWGLRIKIGHQKKCHLQTWWLAQCLLVFSVSPTWFPFSVTEGSG